MNGFAKLAVIGLLLLGGCSKAKDGGAPPEAAGSAAGSAAPTGSGAAVPTDNSGAAAPTDNGAAAPTDKKPLSDYLGAAVSATVYEVKLGASGAEKTKTAALDEAATKAYLGGLDLAQRADGPVPRCPSDKLVELADAKGEVLATIGFCEGKAATFILPGGNTVGGINAAAP